MKAVQNLVWVIALLVADQARGTPVDPRGPINYPGMKVVADQEGVHTSGYSFHMDDQKTPAWQARWIGPGEGKTPPVAMFRKEISLAEKPVTVAAWVSGDTKFRLYVNGRLAARGPIDIGSDFAGGKTGRWFYDYRDLSPYFIQGKNVIAAEVFHNWPVGHTVSRGQTGFLFQASITLPNQEKFTVKSDSTWRAQRADQFPSPTQYEPAKEPAGWRLPGFDDSAWPTCTELKDLWAPLVPSDVPPLMEVRYPVQSIEGLTDRVLKSDGSFRVHFDRVLSAYPTIHVRGGKGAVLTLKAHRQAKMILGDGDQFFEFPFLTEIVPDLTVELKNVTTPVEIVDVGAVFTSQPLAYRGTFSCSDDKLNRIWKVSRWAVQICLQTHHLDSPNHQEPISDPGDYLIESMVNFYAFAQPWLARQDVRKFAWLLKDEKYHNFHTSYSIGWLQMLLDYYDFTGDRKLVEEMAPYVHELLDTYATWRGKNGLISEAPNYMFMDWVNIAGFGCHHPPAVIGQGYLTAFYYHGMAMGSRIAQMMGDTKRVQNYARLRGEIAEAFNRELWVADKGLYRDGKPFQTSVKPHHWLPADKNIETFSPHVNLLAVLYDLAPKEKQAAIVEAVLAQKFLNTQPWFMHWVFQAIDHAGLFDKFGTSQMRRWHIVQETQSFREMWHGGDLSHGWCSTPLVQMSSRVLGVQPTSPGFKSMVIRPTLCDLKWAKGSVPTPAGDVAVSWQLGDNSLELEVTIPTGSEAEVILPTSHFEQATITSEGRPAQPTSRVTAGKHRFQVKGKLKPIAPLPENKNQTTDEACDAFEEDVVPKNLLQTNLARMEDHCSHAGGGKDAGALINGTTRNGSGGEQTRDDGKTFRGYGDQSWLVFHFKQPCDLQEIRTFAGHGDGRASQNYTVLVATTSEPGTFRKLVTAEVASEGGSTRLRLPVKATGIVAVRFEFQSGPNGFNVYREINIIGQVSGKK